MTLRTNVVDLTSCNDVEHFALGLTHTTLHMASIDELLFRQLKDND